jgi:4-carboxymuconolactone decarboxylase
MSNSGADRLGGRLELLDPDRLDGAQRVVYDALTQAAVPESEKSGFVAKLEDGRFIGPFNALLRVPEIAAGFGRWSGGIASSGMAPEVRQVVILTVGASWSAEYEIYAHRAAALAIGIPVDAIDAILAGEPPTGLSAEALLAHRFTAQLVSDHSVPDDLYATVIDTFGEAGTVAIACLIGEYLTVSSILVCFQVPMPNRG